MWSAGWRPPWPEQGAPSRFRFSGRCLPAPRLASGLREASCEADQMQRGTEVSPCTLTVAKGSRSICRAVANRDLSSQGKRVRSSHTRCEIASRQSPIPETCGYVLGTRVGRRTRARSIVKNDGENEPPMTTYPLEFHKRSEQKWALRAQALSARESTPRASQRGQRGSGLIRPRHSGPKPGCGKLGNGSGPSMTRSSTPSRNVSPRSEGA